MPSPRTATPADKHTSELLQHILLLPQQPTELPNQKQRLLTEPLLLRYSATGGAIHLALAANHGDLLVGGVNQLFPVVITV